MGSNVCGKYLDARYAPGMRTSRIESELCRNEMPDLPQAQK